MTESHPSGQETASHITPCIYSHVSTYRSLHLELHLYSPSLKVDTRGPIAVFSNHDDIGGKVVLDCPGHQTGKLALTVEGSIIYPMQSDSPYSEIRRHVFYSHSHVISVASEESSRFAFRDAFMKRRPSSSNLNFKPGSIERSFPFHFPLSQGSHPKQELPSTFTSQWDGERPLVMTSEVSYKMIVTWEPDSLSDQPSQLEIPFILQQDAEFHSLDSNSTEDAWLEIPLLTERPMPVRLAIALPSSTSFSRKSSVPYYVVFTTTPRSPSTAKEIAADSTIYVALTRQIVINEPQTMMQLTPPSSPSTSEEGETSPRRLLRRVAKSSPRLNRKRRIDEIFDKPLPELPMKACFSESKTIYNDFFVGFPKRPRHRCEKGKHPTLAEQSALPDGLLKSKIALDADMLPSVDWVGVSVKYYLEISVSIGQDDWRARIPIRVF
ncbi:hypothetical protein CC1G_03548 [Coprinopsis cinerea okayama7|uniref:Arrestin-like N-terminal domain-containing protein n=1 Tax=Coprinopsis cinerea (strain Okayama-7 / 130 / ATCC MYA-4618 / FGSC 9003) TaxID=240176 RepID=A8NCJ0_COPC7|nr:hypothetical protein CC1G_03548 [Coprinopsis cinerea okayama7\|eukprot:XP_001832534.2 hypothetical protein CC1G_03548 [Coprinopsis cinerea okayama7\